MRVASCRTWILALSLLAVGWPVPAAPAEEEDADTGGGRFEIVRATGDRVWRLDRQTGEIAVCTLRQDRLICTTSSEAVIPGDKSYEDLEAEERERVRKEQERELALLDRVLELIRDLMALEMGEPADGDDVPPSEEE